MPVGLSVLGGSRPGTGLYIRPQPCASPAAGNTGKRAQSRVAPFAAYMPDPARGGQEGFLPLKYTYPRATSTGLSSAPRKLDWGREVPRRLLLGHLSPPAGQPPAFPAPALPAIVFPSSAPFPAHTPLAGGEGGLGSLLPASPDHLLTWGHLPCLQM